MRFAPTTPNPMETYKRGIYIIANDRALEHSIAFMNSLRKHDPTTPVMLIPYDDQHEEAARVLSEKFGVMVFEDLEFIDRLSRQLQQTFGESFFARPNQFRKQACWFGPFEEFIYIDTDIVVFEPIAQNLDYLQQADFICCDYQHRGGLANLFSQKVVTDNIFSEAELADTFNGGFWGSRRGMMTEEGLYDIFQECAAHADYFDFSQKTSDQPIINYMVLKRFPRRFNIVRRPGGAPGNWGGSSQFTVNADFTMRDPAIDQPLQYLHWAGIRIEPGCPYWEVWKHHRYLNEVAPSDAELMGPVKVVSPMQKLRQLLPR
jgi:Mannosyltransferase putative